MKITFLLAMLVAGPSFGQSPSSTNPSISAKSVLALYLVALLLVGCTSPPRTGGIPMATQAAINQLHVGMTEEAALTIMKPVALDSGRVTWGGTGRGLLYFKVSETQQFFLELGPGPECKVTRVGSLEPTSKWTRDSRTEITPKAE